MSTYNLKAKNRETGEIVEVKHLGIGFPYQFVIRITDSKAYFYSTKEFNTLYEVIDDIPKKTIQVPICNSCRKPHFGNKDYNNNCGCDSCGDWTMGEIESDVDDTPHTDLVKVMQSNTDKIGHILTKEPIWKSVIDDTPIEKGWMGELRAMFTIATYRVHDNGYVRLAPSEDKVFIDFIEQIEQQAYKRGQEEAYRKSAEVARRPQFTGVLADSETGRMINQHGTNIALEIEELASNNK